MIKNYFKIALRNLLKHKTFSLVNLVGLAVGLASFILIALYVNDELSYDRYNEKADRIYRVDAEIKFGGNELNLAVSSDPMGAALKKDYPEVEQYVRLRADGHMLIKKGNEFISEDRAVYADSTLFDVFTLPAIAGDTKTALNERNTVVITETTAKKYFNTPNALGKVLEIDTKPYKVTAVIKDVPNNSHFHFNAFLSMDNLDYHWGQFLSHNFQTYLVLRKGTDPKAFEKHFSQFTEKHIFPEAKQFMQIKSMDDFAKAGNKLRYSLTPLTDIHLRSDRTAEIEANGSIQYVYIFSAVALFILLIACINFMNLSTARSANRAREVGIRKVLGTERRHLITQFLMESTIMAVLSMLIAVAVASLILPLFNDVANKQMEIQSLFTGKALVFILTLPFVVGIVAGMYPAFFLSGFRPIQVLKGKFTTSNKSISLRSSLVVFQFAASIILIIGSTVIYKQLHYIQNKKLGFSKDQVLMINHAYSLDKNVDAFKNEMLGTPGVTSATVSGFLPVNSSRNDFSYSKDAVMDPKNALSMQTWRVDYDYIKTLGMEIVKGRNFSKDFPSDSNAIILNESAAKVLGYNDPIGKTLYNSIEKPGVTLSYNIIGVVKDFNYESLRQNIGPLSLRLGRHAGIISLKVNAANVPEVLTTAEAKWKVMAPGMPFSHTFLNEAFDEMYRSEMRIEKIVTIFSILAIFIACLGLFGLATFIAEQRTREIGIRKVLGASVQGIVGLLSKEFLKLVFIGFIIAVPVSWWAMHAWLQDFAYRVNISWWIFIIAGVVSQLVALATVGYKAIKSAISNPVKSLRTE